MCVVGACLSVAACGSDDVVVGGASADAAPTDGATIDGAAAADASVDAAAKCTPIECDDKNPCTTDACDPKKGCTAANVQDGSVCLKSSCNDLTFQPTGTCISGTCGAPATKSCDDKINCTTDTCDAVPACASASHVLVGGQLIVRVKTK